MRLQLAAQGFAQLHHGALGGAVAGMSGQPPHRGHAGHAHQRAAPPRLHRRDERLEGGGHTDHIGLQQVTQHRQVFGQGQVDADADAGVGHDHIGQALLHQAGMRHGLHGGLVAHIGRIHRPPVGGPALGEHPLTQQLGTARHQGHAPA